MTLWLSSFPDLDNGLPRLSPRAAGWLRHLHRKATTSDDWSEDGQPLGWWDQSSTPPMFAFPRFDLSESSYALGVMADQTPAWREVYGDILARLAERHVTYWGAIDWLTQFGHDPRRGNYPQEWIDLLIPKHMVGNYDVPGWVANGIEPWGLQPDPIGADGNLFFKGWLNLLQSMHGYVTGEDPWGSPWQVAGVDRSRFEWTQHRLVSHLVEQWTRNPLGVHCENTKIYPLCLSAAGLGLQLYDAVFGQSCHAVYDEWLERNKSFYFGIDPQSGKLDWAAFYYDPTIRHMQKGWPASTLGIAFYMLPQEPVFAEYLYRSGVALLGWNDYAKPIVVANARVAALGLAVSREFGDYVTEARLRQWADAHFDPRWFGDGEFGFWFHLPEAWPRGQFSALAMVSEVGPPGSWARLFRQPNLSKFSEPTVEGVDYPRLGIAQAWNDPASGVLQVATYAGEARGRQGETSFRVTRLPNSADVQILHDGEPFHAWRATAPDAISVDTTFGNHVFQIFTGHRSGAIHGLVSETRSRQPGAGSASARLAEAARPPDLHLLSAASAACACCAAA